MSHFELPCEATESQDCSPSSLRCASKCAIKRVYCEHYAGGTVLKLLTVRVRVVWKRSNEASIVTQPGLDGGRTSSEATPYCHVAYGAQHAGRRSEASPSGGSKRETSCAVTSDEHGIASWEDRVSCLFVYS